MTRLFVAIDLPPALKAALIGLGGGVPGANWVDEEGMHLTLRFIGEVDGLLFRDIRQALGDVLVDPFDLVLEGVGTFPPRGTPTVLWAGVEKHETLLSLKHKIDGTLASLGIEPEGRKYSPHITLARLKDAPMSHLGDFLVQHARLKTEPFEVNEFHLFSSTLTSNGPIYEIEETYSLLDDED